MNEPQRHPGTPAPPSAFTIWLEQQRDSLLASLWRAARKPWATLLTLGVMATALALPLGLALILGNVERLAGNVQDSREISLFLKPETSAEQAETLARELENAPDIAHLEWQPPDEGMALMQQNPALAEVIKHLQENPLPHLFIITPNGDERALAARLENLPLADVVQHDAIWRERLDRWLGFGERLVWLLVILLGGGALLVVGNTVRLDIQSRKEEIGVLQLLGAADGFIRRPFLYLGAWYGLGGGLLALALLGVARHSLAPPLADLAKSYGSDFALQGFSPGHTALILTGTTLLGLVGAGIVTSHYLRQARSERTT